MLLKQYQFTITLSNEIFINLSYCNNHTYSVPQYFLKNRVFLDIFHIHLQPQQKIIHCNLHIHRPASLSLPFSEPQLLDAIIGFPRIFSMDVSLTFRDTLLGTNISPPEKIGSSSSNIPWVGICSFPGEGIPYVVGRNYENPWIWKGGFPRILPLKSKCYYKEYF